MAYRKIALVVILLASSLACRTPFNPEYWFNLTFDSPPTLPHEMSTDTPAQKPPRQLPGQRLSPHPQEKQHPPPTTIPCNE